MKIKDIAFKKAANRTYEVQEDALCVEIAAEINELNSALESAGIETRFIAAHNKSNAEFVVQVSKGHGPCMVHTLGLRKDVLVTFSRLAGFARISSGVAAFRAGGVNYTSHSSFRSDKLDGFKEKMAEALVNTLSQADAEKLHYYDRQENGEPYDPGFTALPVYRA